MTCPNCGGSHVASNLIEEELFVEAAQHAGQLRHFGRPRIAAGLLGALSVVKIANFVRKRWRCLECGALFDE
ncbi:hypothetical protein ACO2Q1_16305 [Brevundimonas sp. VNH65]|uniref:hypothetical protein n=1 Tax=Brevundimonas sp. VNH65 TaxID=3400917 RepID=UPI003C00D492